MANSTVNLPLKSLMARLVSCRVVLWALTTHGPRLSEISNGTLGPSLAKGMRQSFEQHMTQLQEVLATARDLLIVADRNLRDQKARTSGFRRIRDKAFKELSPWVKGIKDTFRGACGDDITVDIGFALRMPTQAADLHEQAVHLLDRLSSPEELPAVRYRGVTLEPLTVAEEMRPMVERLGETLENVVREERQSDAMKIARDEALAAYDRAFQWVAGSAESLFKLANLPELAKRVRPSSRRRGVTEEVETQGPEIPINDPDDTTDEVTDVPSDVSASVEPDIPPAG